MSGPFVYVCPRCHEPMATPGGICPRDGARGVRQEVPGVSAEGPSTGSDSSTGSGPSGPGQGRDGRGSGRGGQDVEGALGPPPSGRRRCRVTFEASVLLEPGDQFLLGRQAPGVLGTALAGFDNVSGRHADLAVLQGAVEVTDRGSRNGTFVQGERLEPGAPKHVDGPVTIRLAADCVLRVDWEDVP